MRRRERENGVFKRMRGAIEKYCHKEIEKMRQRDLKSEDAIEREGEMLE